MLVDSSNSAGSAVTGAIAQASQATGTSFGYLLATAKVESGLNPQAGAPTSSARGLFQFIDTTWLATMKQAGPSLGYTRYADAITHDASGNYEVRDRSLRNEILKLRGDPTANALMAGAFTKANASILNGRLGRSPSEGELYIAHFLGAGGAARLITLAATDPSLKAADFFPHAAAANTSIFYDRSTGHARTVAQVRDVLTARFDVARGSQDRANSVAQAAPASVAVRPSTTASAATPQAPDTAGIASAFAAASTASANDHRVFHGLFADGKRAPMVGALWSVPETTPAAGASATTQKPLANGMLDLFKDLPAKGA
jgi:hypothetical protein